jgi:hypothetical protein
VIRFVTRGGSRPSERTFRAASKIIFLKQIGLGAMVAVLVDAFVVRSTLVPALMALLGEWNWWSPPVLRRWHARTGLDEGPGPVPQQLWLSAASCVLARCTPATHGAQPRSTWGVSRWAMSVDGRRFGVASRQGHRRPGVCRDDRS